MKTLTRGDQCYFAWNGSWKSGTMVDSYDFKNAVKVRDAANLEYIVKQQEAVTLDERQKQIVDQKKVEAAKKWSGVVCLWNEGKRSPAYISTILENKKDFLTPSQVSYAIRRLKELGVIQ